MCEVDVLTLATIEKMRRQGLVTDADAFKSLTIVARQLSEDIELLNRRKRSDEQQLIDILNFCEMKVSDQHPSVVHVVKHVVERRDEELEKIREYCRKVVEGDWSITELQEVIGDV